MKSSLLFGSKTHIRSGQRGVGVVRGVREKVGVTLITSSEPLITWRMQRSNNSRSSPATENNQSSRNRTSERCWPSRFDAKKSTCTWNKKDVVLGYCEEHKTAVSSPIRGLQLALYANLTCYKISVANYISISATLLH